MTFRNHRDPQVFRIPDPKGLRFSISSYYWKTGYPVGVQALANRKRQSLRADVIVDGAFRHFR